MKKTLLIFIAICTILYSCTSKSEPTPDDPNVTVEHNGSDSANVDGPANGGIDSISSGSSVEKNGTNSNSNSGLPSFDAYKVAVDNKKNATLDFKSNPDATNFKTRLTEAFKSDTANFAGHCTFVEWGCGTSCQSSMIIDRQTGKIYNSIVASSGYEFHPDSKLLIVNPPDGNAIPADCEACKPGAFIWDEASHTLTKK